MSAYHESCTQTAARQARYQPVVYWLVVAASASKSPIEGNVMNVVEGLQTIRARLVENDAGQATIDTVDLFIKRASLPAAKSATVGSQLQLVRMLMRTASANNSVHVYNDLARVEEEMEISASRIQAEKAAEEAKPVPKSKKYYKNLKEKEKQS
jgi:hypothetical protein